MEPTEIHVGPRSEESHLLLFLFKQEIKNSAHTVWKQTLSPLKPFSMFIAHYKLEGKKASEVVKLPQQSWNKYASLGRGQIYGQKYGVRLSRGRS